MSTAHEQLAELDAEQRNVASRASEVQGELTRLAGRPRQPGIGGHPGEIAEVREQIADAQRAAARHGNPADTSKLEEALAGLEHRADDLRRELGALTREHRSIDSERAALKIARHGEFVAYADQVAADGVQLLEAVREAQAKVEMHRPLVLAAVELAVAGVAHSPGDEPGPDSIMRQRLAQREVDLRLRYAPWTDTDA